MGFGEAVRLFFKNYVNFQGRARRAEFWWPYLLFILVYIALIVIVGALSALGDVGAMIGGLVALVIGLFMLAMIIPSLSVTVRRLHDKNMSGWMILIGLIPFAGFYLLYLYVTEGTQGPNQYGEDPKGLGAAPGVFE